MFVATLLRRPSEEVEGEIGVGLGAQSLVDVRMGEAGLELLDPAFKLLLERSLRPDSWNWEVQIFSGR